MADAAAIAGRRRHSAAPPPGHCTSVIICGSADRTRNDMCKPGNMRNRRNLLTRSLAMAAPLIAFSDASRGGSGFTAGAEDSGTSCGGPPAGRTSRNKRLMTEIYEAVARGDGSKFVEHLAEDAVFTVTGQSSWSGSFKVKTGSFDTFVWLPSLLRARAEPFRFACWLTKTGL